jgi:L-threonylcarbamoyladenylate synthase
VSSLTAEDARRLRECVGAGGVAVFPSDTVYGLCCDPEKPAAVRRLYELKGRPVERAAAVMFFDLGDALAVLHELRPRERAAVAALLPGGLTLLLANPAGRFAAACGPDPGTLGLRVPRLAGALAALGGTGLPVVQSSANLSGGADARRLADVPEGIRAGADLVLDGGELAGTPSTVVDLRAYEEEGRWEVLRVGAVSEEEVALRLA